MTGKRPIVAILSTLGLIILLVALLGPLQLFSPHYALVWAIVCWVIAGSIQRYMRGGS